MIVGALGAFKELKIRSFISYTSINQAGFILLGLCCQTELGIFYALYYLFIYILTTFGFLALLLNLFKSQIKTNLIYFNDLKHFCKSNTTMSLILSIFVLSFAGLPPFAGFFAKLYIYFALAKAKLFILLLLVLFLNIISLYYYVRILKSL
jgi:NADH:ubiquinone oxidoreductase subunit 2 (subunit N)